MDKKTIAIIILSSVIVVLLSILVVWTVISKSKYADLEQQYKQLITTSDTLKRELDEAKRSVERLSEIERELSEGIERATDINKSIREDIDRTGELNSEAQSILDELRRRNKELINSY